MGRGRQALIGRPCSAVVRHVTAICALLLLPLAILLILRANSHDTLAGVTFDAAPVLAAPTPRDVTDETPVKVTPTWAKGDSLFAPGWSGIVTAVGGRRDVRDRDTL